MTRRCPLTAIALAASLLVIASLVDAGPVIAADPAPHLQLAAEERDDGSWMLRATLARGATVQTQETVEFFQLVDFFGQRQVPLGSATTDAAGVASRLYTPTSNGPQEIVARTSGETGTTVSDPVQITASGAAPLLPGPGPVLPIVQALAFPVGAAVLFLVWLALAGILVRAIHAIIKGTAEDASTAVAELDLRLDPIEQEAPERSERP